MHGTLPIQWVDDIVPGDELFGLSSEEITTTRGSFLPEAEMDRGLLSDISSSEETTTTRRPVVLSTEVLDWWQMRGGIGRTLTPGLSDKLDAEQSPKYPMLSACEEPCSLRAGNGLPIRLGGVCHSVRRRLDGDSDAEPWSAGLFRPVLEMELELDGGVLNVDDGAEGVEWFASGVEGSQKTCTSMSACTPTVLCFLLFSGFSGSAFSVCTPTVLCFLCFASASPGTSEEAQSSRFAPTAERRGVVCTTTTKGSRTKVAAVATGEGVGLRKSGVKILPAGRVTLGVAGNSAGVPGTGDSSGVAGISIGFLLEPGVGVAEISIGFLLEPGVGVGAIATGFPLEPVAGITVGFLRGAEVAVTAERVTILWVGPPGSGP